MGKLWLKGSYGKNEQLEGLTEFFYESGELEYQGNIKRGKPVGKWVWFTKAGKIDYTGKYENGVFLLEDEKGDYKDIVTNLKENKLLPPEAKNILDSLNNN